MITQAEIQSIDYNSNDCIVRIPAFENVSSEFPATTTAKLMCLPGIFNGYLVGDAVWVAFNLDIYQQPVVIGKIYKGIEAESRLDGEGKLINKGGAINCQDLAVANSATLPATTKIITQDVDFNTLEKIIDKLKDMALYGTGAESASSDIVANPSGEPRAELTSIKINGIIYSISSGDDTINGGLASTPDSMYTNTIGGGNASSLQEEIPEPPASDGTYVLKCTVENGIKRYRWELIQ